MRSVLRLRAFIRKYGKAAPGHQSILRWFCQFRETGVDDVPLSPDLTPCDFFLWGHVKDKVYVPQCQQHCKNCRNASLLL
ncbi:hypothetical protein AVEN_73312-1 [Araneus ventricosus]|uniref:Uncharacterized protein n=1 Tax=Araneus ventricosus TaxID=182803 RepID=A0A4Y2H3H4_ARAVE|nr:hypothetical protein AVEN_73312-1 [Araneus ventricosus]